MTSEPRRMSVISESVARTRSVVAPLFEGPAFLGQGPLSYACGGCGVTLIQNAEFAQIRKP
jgi:hypothetical protein